MSPELKEKLENYENVARKTGPYFLKYSFDIPNELESFLLLLIKDPGSHETFDENGDIVKQGDGRRSIGDIFQLCRTHVKENITIVGLYEALYRLYKEQKIGTWFCSHINKRVWKRSPNYLDYDRNIYGILRDEFGLTNEELRNEM